MMTSDPRGYSHWSGKPETPGAHDLELVPQTLRDGWEGYCSCGAWKGFRSFYDFERPEELIAKLRADHAEHVATQQEKPSV